MSPERLRDFRRWVDRSSGLRSRWALVAAVAVGLIAGSGLTVLLLHGPVLLDVRSPSGHQTVGLEGVEVWVLFAPGRTRSSTFRAFLNGADVTSELDVAENGAIGSLYGLLDGENELRLEVLGEALWPRELLVQEARTFRILFRPPVQSRQG